MVSVINLNEHQYRRKTDYSNGPILTKPLDMSAIEIVQSTFEHRHSSEGWCGYAILDQIPTLFEDSVISAKGHLPLGVLLFFNSEEKTMLLVCDQQDIFHLIDGEGSELYRNKKIGIILNSVERGLLS